MIPSRRVTNSAAGGRPALGSADGPSTDLTRRIAFVSDPIFQIPNEVRDFAEKSVEQARKAFEGYAGAAQKAIGSVETSTAPFQSGAKDVSAKALGYAEANVNAAFDLARKLLHAKDPQEVLTAADGICEERRSNRFRARPRISAPRCKRRRPASEFRRRRAVDARRRDERVTASSRRRFPEPEPRRSAGRAGTRAQEPAAMATHSKVPRKRAAPTPKDPPISLKDELDDDEPVAAPAARPAPLRRDRNRRRRWRLSKSALIEPAEPIVETQLEAIADEPESSRPPIAPRSSSPSPQPADRAA